MFILNVCHMLRLQTSFITRHLMLFHCFPPMLTSAHYGHAPGTALPLSQPEVTVGHVQTDLRSQPGLT